VVKRKDREVSGNGYKEIVLKDLAVEKSKVSEAAENFFRKKGKKQQFMSS